MRKLLGLIAASAGLAAFASAGGYDNFVNALHDAKTLKTTYNYEQIGETGGTYSLELKKPNMARIDTPKQTIVADGKTVTTYDKSAKTYYKMPQGDKDLQGLLAGQDLALWAPFFGGNGIHVESATDGQTVTRKGMDLKTVNVTLDANGSQTLTVFISPADNLLRQAQFKSHKFGLDSQTILDTQFVTIGGDLKDSLFAFNAPDGSKELSADEVTGQRWYYDLNEAEAVASRTGKKIFVDFFATWCGPCKMLAHDVLDTEEFTTKMSKYFVFLRIDVDAQQGVAQHYGIEAMPTQMVLDKEGNVLGKTVGYGGADAFYQFINQYTGQF